MSELEQHPGPLDQPADDHQATYTIGYGKPPLASRFRPGQSGNRGGRPRKAQSATELDAVLAEKIVVSTPTGPRRISKERLFESLLVNGALQKDKFCMRELNRRQLARRPGGSPAHLQPAAVVFAAVFPDEEPDGEK